MKRNFLTILTAIVASALLITGVAKARTIDPTGFQSIFVRSETQPADDKAMHIQGADDVNDNQNEIQLGDDKGVDVQNEAQLGDDKGVDNNGGTAAPTAEPQPGDDRAGSRHSGGNGTSGQPQPTDDKGGHGRGG
jgi:hypothetical protein